MSKGVHPLRSLVSILAPLFKKREILEREPEEQEDIKRKLHFSISLGHSSFEDIYIVIFYDERIKRLFVRVVKEID